MPFNSIWVQHGEYMVRDVKDEEIKEIFMVMAANKSHGLGGWNALFFKDFCYYIVLDLCKAIKFVLTEVHIKGD